MSENLRNLVLSCLDSSEDLSRLQQLIEIALEQFAEFPSDPGKTRVRLEVLIDCYHVFADERLNQLRADLENVRKQLLE